MEELFATHGNSENASLEERLELAGKRRLEWGANDAKRDEGNEEPEGLVTCRNLSYGPDSKWNLLDLYYPEGEIPILSEGNRLTSAKRKWPLIVSIHGGGYFYGDKELYRFYCMDLAKRGFAVVNFNYLLSPEHVFPAQLDCVDLVMSWVENHAEEYRLDLENVFLIGDSAGAQLCSHYGAIWANDAFRARFGYEKHALTLRGLLPACGMYDVRKRAMNDPDGLMADYLRGTSLDDPRLDVLGAIDSRYPATFVFSAKNDFLREECEPMAELLKSRGVSTRSNIYGLDVEEPIWHVFHVDMKSEVGRKCNDDQAEFIRSMLKY